MTQGDFFRDAPPPPAPPRRVVCNPLADPSLARLTREELDWSDYLALLQLKDWEESGARYTMETTPEMKLFACQVGARGEIYVAKTYDLAFPIPYLRRFSPAPDFGPKCGPGICVRATVKKFYPRIPVRPQDDDRSVFVQVCEYIRGIAKINSYCWGRDAKAHTKLTNPTPYGEVRSSPVHLVPMSIDGVANPIVHRGAIPEEILKLCPRGYRVWSVR